MRDVVAGIVTYNPDISRLRENLIAVSSQVQLVYIVDNGSNNIDDIRQLTSEVPNLEIGALSENYGIARALNEIFLHFESSAEWVLTLDQDSVVTDGYIDAFSQYLDNKDYVSLCPSVCMRIDDQNNQEKTDSIIEVPKCITSGNLVRLSVWNEIGRFKEEMFIDMVDFEFCYRLHRFGYKVYRVNSALLIHELGNPKYKYFLWKKVCVYNHNAFRKYYIIRNSLYLIKEHSKDPDISYIKKFLIKNIAFTLLYEENKCEKVKQMVRGIRDYRKMIGSGKETHNENRV